MANFRHFSAAYPKRLINYKTGGRGSVSDENFQDRLRRISAKSQPQQPMAEGAGPIARSEAPKPNYRLVGAGGAIMALGIQAVKFTNENYQPIKASSGAYAGLGLGFAGIVAFLIGIVIIFRACSKGYVAHTSASHAQYSANSTQVARKPSKIAQVFFSLLGLTFGTIACLYLFMAGAARFIETERAPAFVNGSVIIAIFLCLVSLLFGLISLFLRGYALGRVPFYFFIGNVLTYVAVRAFKINMLEWQQLADFLQ